MLTLLDVFITQDLKIYVKFLLHTKGQGMSRYWILVSGYWINQGMPFLCLSSIEYPASLRLSQWDYDSPQLVGLRRSFARYNRGQS